MQYQMELSGVKSTRHNECNWSDWFSSHIHQGIHMVFWGLTLFKMFNISQIP